MREYVEKKSSREDISGKTAQRMSTNQPKNIFEAVSKSERERIHQREEKVEETPTASVSKMLDRCKSLHETIASSLDRMFQSKGISHTQYQHYISTPKNFSDKDWEVVQETKKNTNERLQKLTIFAPKEEKPSETTTPAEGVQTPSSERIVPKRKPVTKRNWLPMH